jgi:CheY-like chemotaxis protein
MLFLSVISSEPEKQQLESVCTQLGVQNFSIPANYGLYLKFAQYHPDLIIIEVDSNVLEVLHFIKLVRTNLDLEQIPFVLYGPELSKQALDNLFLIGANTYIARPFDIKIILDECIRQIRHHQSENDTNGTRLQEPEDMLLKEIMDRNLPPFKRVRLLCDKIEKLLVFPTTVANVIRITESNDTGAGQLSAAISSDPSMATEILRVANTVFYARGGNRIINIKDAIVRVGFNQVKHLALSMSILKAMNDRRYHTAFSHQEFWIHSLATAIISEKLAEKSGLISPSEAFVGGLLHDLGCLLLNEYYNDLFLQCIALATDNGYRLITAQKELLGFTQNEIVSIILEKWNFL